MQLNLCQKQLFVQIQTNFVFSCGWFAQFRSTKLAVFTVLPKSSLFEKKNYCKRICQFHIYKRRRVVLKGGAIASQKISRYGTTIWPKTYFSGIEIKHVRMYNVSRLWETFWHEKVHSTMALKCKKYSAKTRLLQNQFFLENEFPNL